MYIDLRINLLKSIIYKYMPFSSCDYPLTVNAFHSIGYDTPSRTSITEDIKCCAGLVLKVLQHVFSIVSLFAIEFDLWSNLKKNAILGVVAYYLAGGKRYKLVLDTLPLVDGTSHSAESYSQSIKEILSRYNLEAPTRVVCATTL